LQFRDRCFPGGHVSSDSSRTGIGAFSGDRNAYHVVFVPGDVVYPHRSVKEKTEKT
jgi:hypothetical protein